MTCTNQISMLASQCASPLHQAFDSITRANAGQRLTLSRDVLKLPFAQKFPLLLRLAHARASIHLRLRRENRFCQVLHCANTHEPTLRVKFEASH